MRFLCKVSSTLKVPKFPMTTALQHCLNHLPPFGGQLADFSPPDRFNCLWACSFHFSFHDLRFACHDDDETGLKIVRPG